MIELLISYLLGLLTGAYTFNSRVRKQVNIYIRKASAYLNKPEKARSKRKTRKGAKEESSDEDN